MKLTVNGVCWDAGEVTELVLTLRDGKAVHVTMPTLSSRLVHADTGSPPALHRTAGNRVRMTASLRHERPSRFIRDETSMTREGSIDAAPGPVSGCPVTDAEGRVGLTAPYAHP